MEPQQISLTDLDKMLGDAKPGLQPEHYRRMTEMLTKHGRSIDDYRREARRRGQAEIESAVRDLIAADRFRLSLGARFEHPVYGSTVGAEKSPPVTFTERRVVPDVDAKPKLSDAERALVMNGLYAMQGEIEDRILHACGVLKPGNDVLDGEFTDVTDQLQLPPPNKGDGQP